MCCCNWCLRNRITTNLECELYLIGEKSDLQCDEPMLRPGCERVEHVEEDEGREGHGVVAGGHLQFAISSELYYEFRLFRIFLPCHLPASCIGPTWCQL